MDEDEFARRFFVTDLSDVAGDGDAEGASGGRARRRMGRHPAMMVAVMVASVLMMFMFREDASYWLAGRGAAAGPADLGDSVQWRDAFQADPNHRPAAFVHNRYVRVAGLTAYRTEATADRQAFLKIAFVPLYVHLKDEPPTRASDNLVHLSVSGRLVDLTRTDRYEGVRRFYAESFGLPTRRAWMLVVQDRPGDHWWAAALEVVFGAFIAINGAMLVRFLRDR
jgi:hypothetical protein